MKRVCNFIADIAFNGVVLYALFLLLSYGFYSFTPTSLYFKYSSVEPVVTPVEIGSDYILMRSTLNVRIDGNLYWNDVLRCKTDNGFMSYYSQQDTNALTVLASNGERVSEWKYRGAIPQEPTECQMYSTITRKLPMGVEKQQLIVSSVFEVK